MAAHWVKATVEQAMLMALCLNCVVGAPAKQASQNQQDEEMAYRTGREMRRHEILSHKGYSKVAVMKNDTWSAIEKVALNVHLQIDGIIEGDIMQSKSGVLADYQPFSNSTRVKRNVINPQFFGEYAKWPMSIIPYSIDLSTYTFENQANVVDTVKRALDDWQQQTCLKFLPAGNETEAVVNHTNYVRLHSGSGCWSYVGYHDTNPQDISLAESGCLYHGVVMHEIAHAMGMIHEQARPDREAQVLVLYNNVLTGYEGNFNKSPYPSIRLPTPYDHNSIMHYGVTDFAMSGATIAPRQMELSSLMGQRVGASFYDVKAINYLYECQGSCDNQACSNDGYPRMLNNGSCSCICPYGLGGAKCDEIDVNQFTCGEVVNLNSDGTLHLFTSPNFPNAYDSETKCSWLLKPPVGYIVKLSFNSFNLSAIPSQCLHYVDVRANLIGQPAPSVFCGIGIPQDVYSRNEFQSNGMLVIFDASMNTAASTGFSAYASAYKDGCLGDPCRGAPCVAAPGTTTYQCLPPKGNMMCGFDNMILPDCRNIQLNGRYDNYDNDTVQRPWTVSQSSDVQGAQGGFYLSSAATYHGAMINSGTFNIIPHYFQVPYRCLTFKYHMSGDNVGHLNVYRAVNGTLGNPIFNISGPQGDTWLSARLNVRATSSASDLIEIVFLSVHDADDVDSSIIAVDELSYFSGPCSTGGCAANPCGTAVCKEVGLVKYQCPPVSYPSKDAFCSFEDWEDCTSLLSYTVAGDSGDWIPYAWRGPGTTWSRPTGARGPATGLTYLYGQMYNKNTGYKIWLRIYPFTDTNSRCLTFKYCMFGADEGSLSVYRSANGGYPGKKVWSVSGDQGDVWHSNAINISYVGVLQTTRVELTIEIVRGNGFASDYGLDDVSYISGVCP